MQIDSLTDQGLITSTLNQNMGTPSEHTANGERQSKVIRAIGEILLRLTAAANLNSAPQCVVTRS